MRATPATTTSRKEHAPGLCADLSQKTFNFQLPPIGAASCSSGARWRHLCVLRPIISRAEVVTAAAAYRSLCASGLSEARSNRRKRAAEAKVFAGKVSNMVRNELEPASIWARGPTNSIPLAAAYRVWQPAE